MSRGFTDLHSISEMFGELAGYEAYEPALLEQYHIRLGQQRARYSMLSGEEKRAIRIRHKAWKRRNPERVKAAKQRYHARRVERGLSAGPRTRMSVAEKRARDAARARAKYVPKGRPPGRVCRQFTVDEIAFIVASPLTGRQLAKLFGVNEMRISRFRKKRPPHPSRVGLRLADMRRAAARSFNAMFAADFAALRAA